MKTRFGTVVLVPSHKHGFDTKQADKIQRDISDIIDQYIPSQVPGDFLVDINSFHIYPTKFAILRFNDFDKWTEYADHSMIMKRLKERDGVIRLRLGDMLSAIIGSYRIRIWNYLDRSGNTLDADVSEVGVRIPFDVADALNHAGMKRQEFEDAMKKKDVKEASVSKTTTGIINFSEAIAEDFSSQALTVVQDDDSVDVRKFNLNKVDLSPPKTQGRQIPGVTRRKKAPKLSDLKTGTEG